MAADQSKGKRDGQGQMKGQKQNNYLARKKKQKRDRLRWLQKKQKVKKLSRSEEKEKMKLQAELLVS